MAVAISRGERGDDQNRCEKEIWLPHLDSGEHEPAGHDNSYLQLVLDGGYNDFSSNGNYTVSINDTG